MVNRTTWLSIAALAVALAGFVWWNIQRDTVSLVSAGPGCCEVESRGPGWPFPAYRGHARWSRPDVSVGELFRTPTEDAAEWEGRADEDPSLRGQAEAFGAFAARGRQNRWLYNGLVGALLVAALVANVIRAYREGRSTTFDRPRRQVE